MAAAGGAGRVRCVDDPLPAPGVRLRARGVVLRLHQHLGRLGRAPELHRVICLRTQLSARVSDRHRPPDGLPVHGRLPCRRPRSAGPVAHPVDHSDERDARARVPGGPLPGRAPVHRRPRRLDHGGVRFPAQRRSRFRVSHLRPAARRAGGPGASAARVHAQSRCELAMAQPGARLPRAATFDPVRVQPGADPARRDLDRDPAGVGMAAVRLRGRGRGPDARVSRPRLRHRRRPVRVLGGVQPPT